MPQPPYRGFDMPIPSHSRSITSVERFSSSYAYPVVATLLSEWKQG